jgi:protein-S-isoprenylcysteine O-methyltransferase Ste14
MSPARLYFLVLGAVSTAWWAAVLFHDGLRRAMLGDADPRLWIAPDLLLFVVPCFVLAFRTHLAALAVHLAWTGVVLAWFGWRSLEGGRGAWGVIAMSFAFTGSVMAGLRLVRGPLAAGGCFPAALRIRPAAERSIARHLGRTFLQIVAFWSFFLAVLPWSINRLEHRWDLRWTALSVPGVAWTGWILFATQSLLGLWSAMEMVVRGRGTPLPSEAATRLVTTGPYALVRNPMAVAGILQGVAVGLACGSWLVIAYALTGSVVWNTLARPYEEADMAVRFGAEFEAYRRRVRCWIPRLP